MQRYVRLGLFGLLMLIWIAGCSRKDPLYVVDEQAPDSQPVYLEVVPNQAHINVGTTQTFAAFLVNTDLQTRTDVTATSAWTSADPQVAAVNSSGVVTGAAAGQVGIRATYDGVSATATLAVSNQSVTEIWVLPSEQVSLVGLNRQFNAIARFADNRLQDVTH